MATKMKRDNQNLTRSKSLAASTEHEAKSNGSDSTNEKKPLPNYLKPTISSRPDPVRVKSLRKNNVLEDNQKPLLRGRSFDRPLSSLTSPSSSSSPKPLIVSSPKPLIVSSPKPLIVSPPSRRDKPAVPKEKPVTALRSTSSHGSSRSSPKGSSTVKSSPVASSWVKKSGTSSSSGSIKSKKERPENVSKKSSPQAPGQEDDEEIVKVVSPEHRDKDKEEVTQSGEEETVPIDASKEEELIIEGKTEEEANEAAKVEESKKEEVVQGKKESPTAYYNDVIASKLQESSSKRKVLALAGAFQTVIDCEAAAAK